MRRELTTAPKPQQGPALRGTTPPSTRAAAEETTLLRKPGRVRRFWNVEAIVANDAWTMSYRGHNPKNGPCKMNYTCKYEGDLDPTSGLPDGLGRWLDDAWEGEMLT